MINIHVKLFATLRDYGPKNLGIGESFTFGLSDSSNILNLLEKLRIPKEHAKIVIVNGNITNDHNSVLEENDEISIFPPVGGGDSKIGI
ncbi:MAG: MoaD/ThiS family protein [Candidatus Hodarchaeales archaeon]